MFDSMTVRARREREDAELKSLLGAARSGAMLDPDDELQDQLENLVVRMKNAEIVRHWEEAETARGELLATLRRIKDIYTQPDRELEETLAWQGLDNYTEGRIPNYVGDHVVRQKVDQRGRLVEEAELPGIGTRTKVLMPATDVAELYRLQRALSKAELSEQTARASGRSAVQAMSNREAAEADLDQFLHDHGVGLPSRPQPDTTSIVEGGEDGGA